MNGLDLLGVAAVREAVAVNPLATTAIIVGSGIILLRLPGLIATAWFREQLCRFPRSAWWGRVLLAIVAVWAGLAMYGAAADDWGWIRPYVPLAVPIAYVLVVVYADQFLSLRGAAGIGLLVANVMVKAADRSELPARLVVTVLAYIWAVAAIWIAVAPHHGRDLLAWFGATDRRCRLGCAAGIAVGVVLVLLGAFVY